MTEAERKLVSNAVLAKCDALDGAADGLVQDTAACQAAFNLDRDVPTCSGARDGSCLSAAQKTGIAKIFSGPTARNGSRLYASFPYDAGLAGADYGFWEFTAPLLLDTAPLGELSLSAGGLLAGNSRGEVLFFPAGAGAAAPASTLLLS